MYTSIPYFSHLCKSRRKNRNRCNAQKTRAYARGAWHNLPSRYVCHDEADGCACGTRLAQRSFQCGIERCNGDAYACGTRLARSHDCAADICGQALPDLQTNQYAMPSRLWRMRKLCQARGGVFHIRPQQGNYLCFCARLLLPPLRGPPWCNRHVAVAQ